MNQIVQVHDYSASHSYMTEFSEDADDQTLSELYKRIEILVKKLETTETAKVSLSAEVEAKAVEIDRMKLEMNRLRRTKDKEVRFCSTILMSRPPLCWRKLPF